MATASKEKVEKKEVKLNPFEQNIKNYLDQLAKTDELFAVTYAKPNKSIKECGNYVMERAKKGGRGGYTDAEVYGWAVHYYDEDDIKNVKSISGKVVINEAIELTEEEMGQARKQAIERFTEDEKKKLMNDYKVELSAEDLAIAREKAIEAAVEEAKKKMLEKKKIKAKSDTSSPTASIATDAPKTEVKKEESQQSLF